MDPNTKDSLKVEKRMDMDCIPGRMDKVMMVILIQIFLTVKGNYSILMQEI